LTRSHHSSPAEADELPTIHIAGNDGVTFKRVPPKSFVLAPKDENRSFQTFETTQGLRRPRFSFFIFTCQTARDHWDPILPLLEGSRTPHPTTNNNRLRSAVESLIVMRSFTGARIDALASWPMHRRAQWPGYRPARSGLSTPFVNKLSHHLEVFCDAKKSLYFGPLAALEPQSCDVLTTSYAMNRRMPVGAAGDHLPGTGDFDEPVAFPKRPRNFREICTPLTFEIPAGFLLASDSRISMRATCHVPEPLLPSKGRKRRLWIGRRSFGC
jgi:hypothetical protein